MNVKILGTGFYVPSGITTNKDLEKLAPTNAEWVEKNTGIRERRIADQGETSSYLGQRAALNAMLSTNTSPREVDMLIVATATPDKLSPSTACIIKDDLGLANAVAFDVSAVCSGFLFGMSIAEKYIASGEYKRVLVVGVDVFSTITNWKHRDCVFFGDGAGAVIMAPTEERGFLGFSLYSDSYDMTGFYCDHGKNFTMDAHAVYATAVRVLPIAINGVLKKVGMKIEDVDYLIPHQPSIRILEDVAGIVGIPRTKVMTNMQRYGNTVAGTIPILLAETWGKLKKGDIVLFAAIGSGWSYGAAIYEV